MIRRCSRLVVFYIAFEIMRNPLHPQESKTTNVNHPSEQMIWQWGLLNCPWQCLTEASGETSSPRRSFLGMARFLLYPNPLDGDAGDTCDFMTAKIRGIRDPRYLNNFMLVNGHTCAYIWYIYNYIYVYMHIVYVYIYMYIFVLSYLCGLWRLMPNLVVYPCHPRVQKSQSWWNIEFLPSPEMANDGKQFEFVPHISFIYLAMALG